MNWSIKTFTLDSSKYIPSIFDNITIITAEHKKILKRS